MQKPEEYITLSKSSVIDAENNRVSMKKLLQKFEELKKESGIEDVEFYFLKAHVYENTVLDFHIYTHKCRNKNYKEEYKAWLEEELKKLDD